MANKSILDLDYAKYDFKDPEKFVFKSEKGLSRQTVEQISDMKKEPEWMKKFRLRAYEHFLKRPMPTWGGNLSHIDFNDIYYYLRPTDKVVVDVVEVDMGEVRSEEHTSELQSR